MDSTALAGRPDPRPDTGARWLDLVATRLARGHKHLLGYFIALVILVGHKDCGTIGIVGDRGNRQSEQLLRLADIDCHCYKHARD